MIFQFFHIFMYNSMQLEVVNRSGSGSEDAPKSDEYLRIKAKMKTVRVFENDNDADAADLCHISCSNDPINSTINNSLTQQQEDIDQKKMTRLDLRCLMFAHFYFYLKETKPTHAQCSWITFPICLPNMHLEHKSTPPHFIINRSIHDDDDDGVRSVLSHVLIEDTHTHVLLRCTQKPTIFMHRQQ